MVDLVKQLREPVSGESAQVMVQWAADEIERLKAQLWKYGKHLTACRLQKTHDTWCDCGWTEVRATLAPTQADGGTVYG